MNPGGRIESYLRHERKGKGEDISTMKIFARYNPAQIARYVKTLFRGRLYIQGMGAFEFDYGKILPPKIRDKRHLSAMREINQQVSLVQMQLA